MGAKRWFVDLEIIVQGSTEQGFQGRHYFWSMRLHKEAFEATAQTKLKFFIENFESNDAVLFMSNRITKIIITCTGRRNNGNGHFQRHHATYCINNEH